MKLPLLFKLIFFGVVLFFLTVALTLAHVTTPDYLEDVNGIVITDVPPSIILAEKQYRIKNVFTNKNQRITQGQAIIEFVDTELESTVEKSKHELSILEQELILKYQQKILVEEKIETTEQLVTKRTQLRKIKSQRIHADLDQQKKNAQSNTTLVALSESLQQDMLNKLNSEHLSTVDKIDILTKSNDKLQSYQEQQYNIANNDSLLQESNLIETIDIDGLKRTLVTEQIELNLITLSILELEGKIFKLKQEYENHNTELQKLSVKSPVDGEVIFKSDTLHQSNIFKANEHLITLLPTSSGLQVELILTDEHHKDIQVGQEVHMQLHAWNHYKHGIIKGHVTDISKGKNTNSINGQHDFIARVSLNNIEDQKLKFGYTLTAKIVLQEISLFDYILKKLNFTG